MHKRRTFAWMMVTGVLSILFQGAFAQTISKPPDGVRNMSFDVVSIRQSKFDKRIGGNFTAEGYSTPYIPVQFLIVLGYNLIDRDLTRIFGGKLLPGAPGWLLSDGYAIQAKISPADQEALKKLSFDQQSDQKRLMIRSMLADRFKLRVREEAKPGPCYALVVDKAGPKIKKVAAPSDPASHDGDALGGPGFIRAKSAPLSQLVRYLAFQQLKCPIPDRTGLTGNYAFSMQYSEDQDSGATSSTDTLPDLFTALREQLGLRLVPVTIPIPSITVEHVERPSDN